MRQVDHVVRSHVWDLAARCMEYRVGWRVQSFIRFELPGGVAVLTRDQVLNHLKVQIDETC